MKCKEVMVERKKENGSKKVQGKKKRGFWESGGKMFG